MRHRARIAPALLWRCMPPKHKHRLSTFLIKLLEQERLLFQPKTAFLVAVHDVEGVLPPVVVDVVAFEGLGREEWLALRWFAFGDTR